MDLVNMLEKTNLRQGNAGYLAEHKRWTKGIRKFVTDEVVNKVEIRFIVFDFMKLNSFQNV